MSTLNLDTFWVLLEHALSVTPLLLFAYGFRTGVIWVYGKDDIMSKVLLFMDNFMVVGVVGWLIVQAGIEPWNRRKRLNSLHVFSLA